MALHMEQKLSIIHALMLYYFVGFVGMMRYYSDIWIRLVKIPVKGLPAGVSGAKISDSTIPVCMDVSIVMQHIMKRRR
jgi:hypothetical protein